MVNDVTLGAALRSTLTSINRAQKTIDIVTERLSTGRNVNSAIDAPQNFFTSRSLSNRASDNSRLLDDIGQSLRTIQQATIGLEATEKLLNQGEAIILDSKLKLENGETNDAVFQRSTNIALPSLDSQIIAGNPDVYFRLDETSGSIIDYGVGVAGPVAATYSGGVTAGAANLYSNGAAPSVEFDGVNGRIRVDNSFMINTSSTSQRTVELTFNADTVSGRQVLYEEGGTTNGFTIYIDDGLLRVEAEDDSGALRFGNLDISAPIIAGETYHAAFVFNGANGPAAGGAGPNTFTGYINGTRMGFATLAGDSLFPSHPDGVGIGRNNGGLQFHDGESTGSNSFYFDGRISNVAIYNRALSDAELLSRGTSLNSLTSIVNENRDFNAVLDQLDQVVIDANYRGVNLLDGEDLRTDFNPERTSFLITEGKTFSAKGLGILRSDFRIQQNLETILEQIQDAREQVREFAFSLANDLSVISMRDRFTREHIITLEAGSDDLTLADQNEEGANLLALQTRLSLGFSSLSIASQSQAAVIDLIGNDDGN